LGVVAQRLIRRVCANCRTEATLPEKDRASWGLTNSPERKTAFVAHGCGECHQTGYIDRVGIFELLPVTEAIHDLITLNPKGREIVKAARREGMTTLREDAVRKLREGATTVDEVLRVTHAASMDVAEGA
jgi:type II secretory ATPase GspE/PulE/Tfp pilus assembly ATPase PilB-like protein